MALKHFLCRHYPFAAYGSLALLIMAPLLRPGFVFALDMVPTPVWRLPGQMTSSYLFYACMHALNFAIPADVLQKLLLLAIFLLAGLGMHKLVGKLHVSRVVSINQELGTYFSGTFYVVNPYTYSRFMAGQFAVLFGYALLPWFMGAVLGFLREPGWRKACKVGGLAAIIGIVSIHTLGLLLLILAIGTGLTARRLRQDPAALRRLTGLLALGVGVFIVLSSYWLLPLAVGHGTTASAISGFGAGDQQAFMTLGHGALGRLANIERLEGFWVEAQGLYRLPQALGPLWWPALGLVLGLAVTGAIQLWRTGKQHETIWLGLSVLLAAVLAAALVTPWLSTHVPLFAGYREPHKFAGLVALAYAVFAGNGVVAVLDQCQRQGAQAMLAVMAIFAALPFVFTPSMLLGGGRQLSTHQYPSGWFTVNARLNADPHQFKVLFLPWHLYMHFDFAGTIIANPAQNFFDKPTLVSNNPEFGRSSPNQPDSVKAYIAGHLLPDAQHHTDLAARLSHLHIKYIVLAEESDSSAYQYLDHQKGLRLTYSDSAIRLYKNDMFGRGE
ncbi:MAG TPA: hypothetical protein VLF59_04110 [Candidatus Saccharimonadales bacterium]|nr:hypothetical protein [Candidatus Saccharimonadales bacterium]